MLYKTILSIKRNLEYVLFQIKYGRISKKAFSSYFKIERQVIASEIVFFFPYWCYGGGERVHADILKVFSQLNTTCFITGESPNDGFKDEFFSHSTIIELNDWPSHYKLKEVLLRKIASSINKSNSIKLFGCNSKLFYDLIPLVATHVKVVDLIHAFSGPYGAEYFSLPCAIRLNKRIILGQKTKHDFANLYNENGIDKEYLKRLEIIPNRVNVPHKLTLKDYSSVWNILFVARNSEEKRPEIFFKIAEIADDLNLPLKFYMVGDFKNFKEKLRKNSQIIEETNKSNLNKYYASSHLLLVTSLREGLPMVILEGMSYGVVPISTNVGEIPFYISKDNKVGYLIENELDIEFVAEKFIKQLKYALANVAEVKSFAENGHQFVKTHFSEKQFSAAYTKAILS